MSKLSEKITNKYNSLDSKSDKTTYIIALLIVFIVLFVAIGFAEMALWNWLMPYIFGLPKLSFWQAVGLDALIFLLFYNSNN